MFNNFIELIRIWKNTWSPLTETIVSYVIFFGGYIIMQILGSMLAEFIENKKWKEFKKLKSEEIQKLCDKK